MKNTFFAVGLIMMLSTSDSLKAGNFSIEDLSEDVKTEMRTKKTWKEECPVGLDRLKLIKFSHYDFEGQEHEGGEIVILDAVSEHAMAIFKELHELRFPFAKAIPMEHYNGSDEDSMKDNNTSCFNYRESTEGSGLPSLHAYGLAIDINPIHNPYKKQGENVLPPEGFGYLDRGDIRPGMAEDKGAVDIFKKHGFTIWGGDWNDPKDWQHFQPSRATAQLLSAMTPKDAEVFFDLYATEPRLFNKIDRKDDRFIELYRKSPEKFITILNDRKDILAMPVEEAYSIMDSMIP